jgi:TatD DNase family protein
MHCFTETWETARAALDVGFYVSFSGILTFKSAAALREVAAKIPLDRVLVETDSPYLAPVPHRGQTNEPGFVQHVAETIATLHGTDRATIEARTAENFSRLFNVL